MSKYCDGGHLGGQGASGAGRGQRRGRRGVEWRKIATAGKFAAGHLAKWKLHMFCVEWASLNVRGGEGAAFEQAVADGGWSGKGNGSCAT